MATCTYHVGDVVQIKKKMLHWAGRFNIFCFLDNSGYHIHPHEYECLLAAGVSSGTSVDDLHDAEKLLTEGHDWIFGHLSYELKSSLHKISSGKLDKIGFPPCFFFKPLYRITIRKNEVVIEANDPDRVYKELLHQEINEINPSSAPVNIKQRLSREEYIGIIQALQQHILRGDCYEINFCQEFFAEDVVIDPIEAYSRLNAISPNPFSCLYRLNDHVLICASPERFLYAKGDKLYSQPIKGTIRRNLSDQQDDERLKEELRQSSKDQSENVMVVDMVRNDLSRVCMDGSVQVDELFGIYSYPQVHQMISTISGLKKPGISFSGIIEAAFPMGSMTGAPKRMVMELIDKYETSARGIFSGSVGYVKGNGDFDFNVVIRSIMYNMKDRYLSYQVGSGITFYSDPQKEWEECLLKAKAIRQVLQPGSR